MATDAFHERLLAIVKSLPETAEDWPWGSIHCKVAGKIFVGWGRDDDDVMCIGIRLSLSRQKELVRSDPRFSIAKYVGKYGGVDMRLGPRPDWKEVRRFIVESYKVMAPKRAVKALEESESSAPRPAAKRRPKRAAR